MWRCLSAFSLALVLSGCVSDYAQNIQKYQVEFSSGNYAEAAVSAGALVDQSTPQDSVVLKLQLASAQRLAGNVKESADTFESVEKQFSDYDTKPEISMSGEALSAFSNPYELPYRGRSLDRIMAATYQALNYLELSDVEKARVAMNRALFRQEDARRIAVQKAAIARSEESAASRSSSDVASAAAHPNVKVALATSRASISAYQDYLNPFSVWLHGVFFLHTAEGASDLEKARNSLSRAAALASSNPFIKDDLELASTGSGRPDRPGSTFVYVVHESGRAPQWSENKINVPLILADRNAPIITMAFPKISSVYSRSKLEVVWAGGAKVEPSMLANVDSIVGREFDDELPVVRTRAITSATVKGIAAYMANKAAEENNRRNNSSGSGMLYLATMIISNSYTTLSAQADLRNWTSLPKSVALARFVAPKGSTVKLSDVASPMPVDVVLPSAKAVMLVCKTPADGGPISVRKIILSK
jgi:hypothetical protein